MRIVLNCLLSLFCIAAHAMENLAEHGVDINLLRKVLQVNTGGSGGKSYYSLLINGQRVGGERSWEDRWRLIKPAMDYSHKRILELGCNLGMCSTYLLKFAHAASSIGVELPHNIFVIRAAYSLQKAFGLNSLKIKPLDLNKDNYEAALGYEHDVVICTSILKWVHDKERFLNYIAHFNHVIFEGHEYDEIEIARFKNLGFTQYKVLGRTQIGASYKADEYRTLIYFSK